LSAKDWLTASLRASPTETLSLSDEERRALRMLKREARKAGATLRPKRTPGLPPSLVLSVMRRDGFRCKVHGDFGTETGGLEVHHKGGLENPSARLLKRGRSNTRDNLVTVCAKAHNEIHKRDRGNGNT